MGELKFKPRFSDFMTSAFSIHSTALLYLLIMKHCLRNPSELDSWDCPLLRCSLLRPALAMLLRQNTVPRAASTHGHKCHFPPMSGKQEPLTISIILLALISSNVLQEKKMNQFKRTLFLLPKEMVPVNR